MREDNLIKDISNELIDLLIDCDDFYVIITGSFNLRDNIYSDVGYIKGGGITIHRDDVEGFYLSIESQDVVKAINMLELNKKWISLSNDDHIIIWDNIIDEYTIRYDNKNNKR